MVDRSRLIKQTDSEIAACYSRERSIFKVARALGIGATTVHRRLVKLGVRLDGRERYLAEAKAFDPEEDAEIRRRYDAGELSADLAKECGVTIYSIKKALKRAGGELRPNPAPLASQAEIARIEALRAKGWSQVRISLEIGRSQSFVSGVYRRLGLLYKKRTGEAHGSWRGGRTRTPEGYWRVRIYDDDPMFVMAGSTGTVLEHRLVMARHLKRPLLRTETVHHINGDRTDNRIENLQVRQGRHGKGVALCCAECGSTNLVPMPIE